MTSAGPVDVFTHSKTSITEVTYVRTGHLQTVERPEHRQVLDERDWVLRRSHMGEWDANKTVGGWVSGEVGEQGGG